MVKKARNKGIFNLGEKKKKRKTTMFGTIVDNHE